MDYCVVIIAAFGSLLSSAVLAEDCGKAPDEVTMRQCVFDNLAASEAELEASYAEIERRLASDAMKSALLAGARAGWIAYRNAECAFQTSGVEGGSVQPIIGAMCMQALTQARIVVLKPYLDCEDGDMSCPVPAPQN